MRVLVKGLLENRELVWLRDLYLEAPYLNPCLCHGGCLGDLGLVILSPSYLPHGEIVRITEKRRIMGAALAPTWGERWGINDLNQYIEKIQACLPNIGYTFYDEEGSSSFFKNPHTINH